MKKLISLTFLVTISLSTFAGGGWVSKEKEGFFMLSQQFVIANQFFNKEGEIFSNDFPKTSVYITNLYGEYGLGKRFEALVNLPLLYRITKNEIKYTSGTTIPGDELTSVGDGQVGIKYGLSEKLPIAVSYRLGLPLGNPGGGSSGILQTGNGAWEHMLRLDASASYSPKGYVSLFGAFNKRTNGYSDEAYWGAETGYNISKFWLILKLEGLNSFQNGNAVIDGSTGLFSNNIEFASWTLECLYFIKPQWGVDVLTSSVVSAKNILAAPAYRVGFFYKLKKASKPSSTNE